MQYTNVSLTEHKPHYCAVKSHISKGFGSIVHEGDVVSEASTCSHVMLETALRQLRPFGSVNETEQTFNDAFQCFTPRQPEGGANLQRGRSLRQVPIA